MASKSFLVLIAIALIPFVMARQNPSYNQEEGKIGARVVTPPPPPHCWKWPISVPMIKGKKLPICTPEPSPPPTPEPSPAPKTPTPSPTPSPTPTPAPTPIHTPKPLPTTPHCSKFPIIPDPINDKNLPVPPCPTPPSPTPAPAPTPTRTPPRVIPVTV